MSEELKYARYRYKKVDDGDSVVDCDDEWVDICKLLDARVAELEGELKCSRAEVERLRAACESAMHDLRSHDGDDEGGYLDDTEQELRKALGLCPNCTDGMEQSGRARITCGTCGDSGKSKEGVV